MANEFTIPETLIVGANAAFGELERQSVSVANEIEAVNDSGNASIGIFSSATGIGAYNFGQGVTFDSASVSYDHNTTQMIFDIGGTDEIIIDASGGTTVTTIDADMVVTGDLTVNGTTTTVNSTDLEITDNIIRVNKDEAGAGVTLGIAGIEVDRGSETDSQWIWDEATDSWGPGPLGDANFRTIGNISTIDVTNSAEDLLIINGVGAIKIPAGTTAQQPVSGINGMVRYNSDLANFEVFVNSAWEELLNTGSSVTISGDLTMDTGAQLFIDDGTVTDPGLAFSDDVNTGIASIVDNSVGLIANGAERLRVGPTEITAFDALDMNSNILSGVSAPVAGDEVGDRDFNDARYIQDTGDSSLTGNLTISDPDEALTVIRTVAGGPVASFAVDSNVLTTNICVAFNADDDANAVRTYGEICVEIVDNVAASLDAKMIFLLQEAGSLVPLATLRQDPANGGGLMEVTATAALYSDLAERYAADTDLEPGTVVVFGGEAEITMCSFHGDTAVAGVISTAPAFRMNEGAGENKTHPYVALKGRVPCKVTGHIKKGDLLVTSNVKGHGKSMGQYARAYTAFARALENFNGGIGVIEVAII